jgi:hypothetical protein
MNEQTFSYIRLITEEADFTYSCQRLVRIGSSGSVAVKSVGARLVHRRAGVCLPPAALY